MYLSIAQFRQVSYDTLLATLTLCKQLMYSWSPLFNLGSIRDNLAYTAIGYSFITNLANGLAKLYLELFYRASLDTVNGLIIDITKLLALKHCNRPLTSYSIYVYLRKVALIFRHAKSRRTTNYKFIIIRFLLEEAGRLLYYYLVFIRPFACMLY
ncbi:hypothetical protein DM02DRAFT_545301 [Periconia macrospinosa]|uniref:Uncharacterized protein n=1 Tax=Periconia macrospinosa TaxID=97972 RepID=A0A2V1D129_9PLEO|nr:hypothetical protein DM02DRAFT_545301 [Periconia macrospinosa]